MPDLKNRRPLKSRGSIWAGRATRALASRNVSPNFISQMSMVAALVAALCFSMLAYVSDSALRLGLLIAAALFCQLRLLCNLLDGMLAVEGAKSEADGPFWNEFPDRISDILIFVGLGLGLGLAGLGWAVATLCVLTAYVRELGTNIGLAADYSGPMAKQHRMALLTIFALLATFETFWFSDGTLLTVALWIAACGTTFTAIRRAFRIQRQLLQNF